MTSPKVSVVMSCYNVSKTLEEAIESILSQTFSDFEFVIIDDGSSDETLEKLRAFQQRDDRINVIVNKENKGLAASLNIGIKASNASWIARMDADDIAMKTRIEKQLGFLTQNPNVDVLGTGITQITQEGEKRDTVGLPELHSDIITRIFKKPLVFHPTVMVKKEVYENIGMYNPKLRWAEDADLWYRIYDQVIFHNLQEPLLSYRVKERFRYKHASQNLKVKLDNLRRRGLLLRYSPQVAYDMINFCRKMILG